MYWLAICVATQTPGGPKPIPTLRKDDPVATRNLWTADDSTGQAEAGAYLFTGFGASLYAGAGAASASPLEYREEQNG